MLQRLVFLWSTPGVRCAQCGLKGRRVVRGSVTMGKGKGVEGELGSE